jgi:hypothetical protein
MGNRLGPQIRKQDDKQVNANGRFSPPQKRAAVSKSSSQIFDTAFVYYLPIFPLILDFG